MPTAWKISQICKYSRPFKSHLPPWGHMQQPVYTASQPYLILKRAKIATLRAPGAITGAGQHVKQEVVLLSRPSVSSSGSAWLLLFLYPTALTTTTTSAAAAAAAAAMLADSMLITLGGCNSRLLRLVTGALIWVSRMGQLGGQVMVWETAHAGAIKAGEHTRFTGKCSSCHFRSCINSQRLPRSHRSHWRVISRLNSPHQDREADGAVIHGCACNAAFSCT